MRQLLKMVRLTPKAEKSAGKEKDPQAIFDIAKMTSYAELVLLRPCIS